MCTGGAEADKQVRAAIRKALTPAVIAGKAKHGAFQLHRSDRASHDMVMFKSFSDKMTINEYDDCTFLCALWGPSSVDEDYNMQILAEPEVHESANQERIDGESGQLSALMEVTNESRVGFEV